MHTHSNHLSKAALILATAALILAASWVAAANASTTHASLMIMHQAHGCHSWALNGGALKTTQSVTLKRGAVLTISNDDVMSHKVVKTSGPAVAFSGKALLGHMGASVKLTFLKAGSYRFTTKPGEDYPGVKVVTTGADHVLHLVVKVS